MRLRFALLQNDTTSADSDPAPRDSRNRNHRVDSPLGWPCVPVSPSGARVALEGGPMLGRVGRFRGRARGRVGLRPAGLGSGASGSGASPTRDAPGRTPTAIAESCKRAPRWPAPTAPRSGLSPRRWEPPRDVTISPAGCCSMRHAPPPVRVELDLGLALGVSISWKRGRRRRSRRTWICGTRPSTEPEEDSVSPSSRCAPAVTNAVASACGRPSSAPRPGRSMPRCIACWRIPTCAPAMRRRRRRRPIGRRCRAWHTGGAGVAALAGAGAEESRPPQRCSRHLSRLGAALSVARRRRRCVVRNRLATRDPRRLRCRRTRFPGLRSHLPAGHVGRRCALARRPVRAAGWTTRRRHRTFPAHASPLSGFAAGGQRPLLGDAGSIGARATPPPRPCAPNGCNALSRAPSTPRWRRVAACGPRPRRT